MAGLVSLDGLGVGLALIAQSLFAELSRKQTRKQGECRTQRTGILFNDVLEEATVVSLKTCPVAFKFTNQPRSDQLHVDG